MMTHRIDGGVRMVDERLLTAAVKVVGSQLAKLNLPAVAGKPTKRPAMRVYFDELDNGQPTFIGTVKDASVITE